MDRAMAPGGIREQRLSGWIEAYSDAILRTCYLYLSDRGQAEDATQDTWIKAWKHMEDFERRGIANEKAWLLRIAVNTCKDYRRTAWFRHVDRERALEELPPPLLAVEPADRTLALTVMALPAKYKQVILLYYFQGLTMQETADALGAAQSTVQRRLKKAEELLKASLTGGEADEE
ncbi:MAG: sigma-70 family RNA polymerase sigma factor [Clostridia bacterium]|nr:sigma-70 family RNA polymerase sigma factor [Clostridia bacterium]MBR1586663.1 sigma-70 family RNA polymerase sigma factor [Clostridia bacterium]